MKHTDTQIQNAIDYAFSACPSSRLTTCRGGLNWTTEAPFRLAIAKNLLENSDTELERIIAAAHEAGWNGVENSKDLAQFILDFEHSIDAKYAKHIHPDDHDRRVKIVQDMAKVEIKELRDELATPQSTHKTKLTQNGPEICLRPDCGVGITHYEGSHPACKAKAADPYADLRKAHAEGKVIEVFVKDDEYGPDRWSKKENNSWTLPPDCYRIKPEPETSTFEAHGKTWTRHTPGDAMPCDGAVMVQALLGDNTFATQLAEDWSWNHRNSKYDIIGWRYADEPMLTKPISSTSWTPAVGDVVQLKSGGPKMTILSQSLNDDDEPLSDTWFCGWIDSMGSTQTWRKINSACLTLVTE